MTDDPYRTFEAFTPGSTLPAASVPRIANGRVIFPFNVGDRSFQAVETSINRGFAPSIVANAPPASDGSNPIAATIVRPARELGDSVAGTIFGATGVGQVARLVRELPAIGNRPLLPPGLVGRIAEEVPAGIRTRAIAWNRVLARFGSNRASTSRIARE